MKEDEEKPDELRQAANTLETFRKTRNPTETQLEHLTMIYMKIGDYEKAYDVATDIMNKNEKNIQALMAMLTYFSYKGNVTDAEKVYNRLKRLGVEEIDEMIRPDMPQPQKDPLFNLWTYLQQKELEKVKI